MRILLIEDDDALAWSLGLMLATEGWIVDRAETAERGIQMARVGVYSAILLDLNLPDRHGFYVLAELRRARVTIPVIIHSAISDVETRIDGLRRGADDYLTKPCNRQELVARLSAIVRRADPTNADRLLPAV